MNEGNELTVVDAGRKGGIATRDRYGNRHFQDIGKKGGQATAKRYRELLNEFGRQGGRPRMPTLLENMKEERLNLNNKGGDTVGP